MLAVELQQFARRLGAEQGQYRRYLLAVATLAEQALDPPPSDGGVEMTDIELCLLYTSRCV